MADQVLRYRLELDSAAMMTQLASIESQAGSQLAQMARPIQMATNQAFQAGADNLVNAQAMAMRAAMSLPQARGFFDNQIAGDGGLLGSGMRAFGMAPLNDYRYTPSEAQYLYGQSFARRLEGMGLSAVRGGLETAGGVLGATSGFNIGSALGRGFGGPGGGIVGGIAGGMLGSQLGEAAYGPLGGAALGGMLGGKILGPLGTLAGAAAGTVVGTGAQLLTEQLANRAALRPLVENLGNVALPFGKSNSPLGTGFTPGEVSRITDDIVQRSSRDLRMGTGDYMKIMNAGGQAGAYDTANTVQKFQETTRDLVENVKLIQTGLRKTIDEAIPIMQQYTAMGVQGRGQVRELVAQTRAASMVTGLTPDQLMQAGQVGTALTKGTFFDTLGQGLGEAGLAGVRYARQQGLIRGTQGQDITRQLISAAGGEHQAGSDASRMLTGFLQSETGQRVLAGAYNPQTRQFDQQAIDDLISGRVSTTSMVNRGSRLLGNPRAMLQYQDDYSELTSGLGRTNVAGLFRAELRDAARSSIYGDTEIGRRQMAIARAREQGIDPASARVGLASIDAQASLRAEMQGADALRGSDTNDVVRERGPMGWLRRAQRSVSGWAADTASDVTRRYIDPMRDKTYNWFNRNILGLPGFSGGASPEAATYGGPGSMGWDLRGERGGLLPSLFGVAPGQMNVTERLRSRFGSGTGELPGYGTVASGGPGIPLPGGRVFRGSASTLRQAEIENYRLATEFGSADGLRAAQGNSWSGDVSKKIERMGESEMARKVRSGAYTLGADPNLVSLAEGLGKDLGYSKKQLKDPALRAELARQAGGRLTDAQLDALYATVLSPGEIATGPGADKLPGQADQARSEIQKILGETARFDDNPDTFVTMAEASLGTGGLTPFKAKDQILAQAGLGTVTGGRFQWRDGVSQAEKNRWATLATRFATTGSGLDQAGRLQMFTGVRAWRASQSLDLSRDMVLRLQGGRHTGTAGDPIYDQLEARFGGGFRAGAGYLYELGGDDQALGRLGKDSLAGLARTVRAGTDIMARGGSPDELASRLRLGSGGFLDMQEAMDTAKRIQAERSKSGWTNDLTSAMIAGAFEKKMKDQETAAQEGTGETQTIVRTFQKLGETLEQIVRVIKK